jgi:hypothetical protein
VQYLCIALFQHVHIEYPVVVVVFFLFFVFLQLSDSHYNCEHIFIYYLLFSIICFIVYAYVRHAVYCLSEFYIIAKRVFGSLNLSQCA